MSDRLLSREDYEQIAQITPADLLIASARATGLAKEFINAEVINGGRIRPLLGAI